ncbi:hypothetical protein FPOA_09200 [Fusarium poae]|uniref:Uncharacterized protein n=1 Tax=Fusarium poae TaxID=36050 RepID=A0A1B8AQV6_FUSPO|nr:hypothetical protein FPOA_09200 [Fusarium poae]
MDPTTSTGNRILQAAETVRLLHPTPADIAFIHDVAQSVIAHRISGPTRTNDGISDEEAAVILFDRSHMLIEDLGMMAQQICDARKREGKTPTVIFCNTIRGKLAAGLLAAADKAPNSQSPEAPNLGHLMCKDNKTFWRLVKNCNLDPNPSVIYKAYILQGFKKLLKYQQKQILLHKLLVWNSTVNKWVKSDDVPDMSDEELGAWLVNRQRKENQDGGQLAFATENLSLDEINAQRSRLFPGRSVEKRSIQKDRRVENRARITTTNLTQDQMLQLGQETDMVPRRENRKVDVLNTSLWIETVRLLSLNTTDLHPAIIFNR